ncbi:MAG TPA: phosphate/phosphite/phosphonate ABC transporter substrate-binding protein [Gammaproteobacteria bacterium]|nr:phosphate/phosphite/phosphonate ABC transporter substrate-binding protein [Gammaproteobacteria bacterium]
MQPSRHRKDHTPTRHRAGYRGRLRRRLLAGILSVSAFALSADDARPILFGVFPYLPPARLEQLYAPVAADLSQAIGHPVQLRTRPTFAAFREGLREEVFDLIFIQPFAYAETAAPHGYRSISRPSRALSALFVTLQDSDLADLGDLDGRILAAPPEQAAVSLLGRQTLLDHHLEPGKQVRIDHQRSHAACLRQIMIHKAAACITAASPLFIFQDRSGVHFRQLAESASVPGSTYAVHQRVPERIRKALQKRIGLWSSDAVGRRLLDSIKMPGFIDSSDRDYDPVRKILAHPRDTTR